MIKVIIVDDHALYRIGVSQAISKVSCFDIEVIGEAGSSTEFFTLITGGEIPDLVMLDIVLPDISGVEIARQLKKEHPDVKIIMLSSEVTEELITELLEIGVDGYLNKLARREDLQTALCTVIGGSQYFGRSVAKMMYEIYLGQQHGKNVENNNNSLLRKPIKENPSSESVLTTREIEVIRLLCDGEPVKIIADKLNISMRTVETHKSNILSKLGFSHFTDLIKYAIKEGIVTL